MVAFRCIWEHLGAPTTSLGAPATSLGAPQITAEQSGRNNILFGNAAGAPGNHSYYFSFNNFWNSCIQFVFSSVYLYIYIATHLHTGYLDWLQAVLESNSRCAWRWQWSELRDTLGGGYCVNLEMHLEAVIEIVWRCTWRPWLSEVGDALGGINSTNLEMHWEAMIDPVWRCIWRPRWCNSEMRLEAVIKQVWWYIWRARSWNLEMHLNGVSERVWRCTWRPWSTNIEELGGGR